MFYPSLKSYNADRLYEKAKYRFALFGIAIFVGSNEEQTSVYRKIKKYIFKDKGSVWSNFCVVVL